MDPFDLWLRSRGFSFLTQCANVCSFFLIKDFRTARDMVKWREETALEGARV